MGIARGLRKNGGWDAEKWVGQVSKAVTANCTKVMRFPRKIVSFIRVPGGMKMKRYLHAVVPWPNHQRKSSGRCVHPRLTSLSSRAQRPGRHQWSDTSIVGEGSREGRTLEQHPPKISATVTPQLIRAGRTAWRVTKVTPMALARVRGASEFPGSAVSSNGPT